MIVFAAADASYNAQMISTAKQYLAWSSIKADREQLNLDVTQTRETEQSTARANETLDMKIQEAYSWLIYPNIDLASGSMDVGWNAEHVTGGGESIVAKLARKLVSDEAAIKAWAPALLRMELDRVLWKDADHIQVKQLWDYLCTYCYLPRLADKSVLESAVRQGMESSEYFGLAAGYSDGRYLELTLGDARTYLNDSDFLVKPAVAKKQIEEDAAAARAAKQNSHEDECGCDFVLDPNSEKFETVTHPNGLTSTVATIEGDFVDTQRPKTTFHMTAKIDNTRVNRSIQTIMDEIVSQLNQLDGAKVELSFEVCARVDGGIPVPSVRAISENCRTMGFDDFGFTE